MTGVSQVTFMNQRSFGAPPGQQAYTTAGSYTWVAPTGVTSVSVVAVGGGGSSAGAFYCCCGVYYSPSSTGGSSTVLCVTATGGGNSAGTYSGTGVSGGTGGLGSIFSGPFYGGGGGAGGYSGSGGAGGGNPSPSGSGGAGGGGSYGAGGGGVGILGQGPSGAGTTYTSPFNSGQLWPASDTTGRGGSGGCPGGGKLNSGTPHGYSILEFFGGFYGGGSSQTIQAPFRQGAGGGLAYKNNIPVTAGASYPVTVGAGGIGPGPQTSQYYSPLGTYKVVGSYPGTYVNYGGAGGAVRIIWPGNTRQFPSTCTGNL